MALGLLLVWMLGLVGCDHATKVAAKAVLASRAPVALVPGVLDLTYVENRDTAFSLTRAIDSPWKAPALTALSAAALLGIAWFAWKARHRASRRQRIALALVAAGAIGNVVDRGRLGYVVDFIHLRDWPVFNVADVIIVAGVLLLLVSGVAPAPRDQPTV